MSQVKGGVYGRARGKLVELVWSQARTRSGTVNTVRQLVVPANPRTPEQQGNRNAFRDSVKIVREIGPSLYQSDFNRIVGQLPGFHSMVSLFRDNRASNLTTLEAWPEIRMGTLQDITPIDWDVTPGSDTIYINYNNSVSGNALFDDRVQLIAVPTVGDNINAREVFLADNVRGNGEISIGNLSSGTEYLLVLYTVQDGSGLRSFIHSETITTQ